MVLLIDRFKLLVDHLAGVAIDGDMQPSNAVHLPPTKSFRLWAVETMCPDWATISISRFQVRVFMTGASRPDIHFPVKLVGLGIVRRRYTVGLISLQGNYRPEWLNRPTRIGPDCSGGPLANSSVPMATSTCGGFRRWRRKTGLEGSDVPEMVLELYCFMAPVRMACQGMRGRIGIDLSGGQLPARPPALKRSSNPGIGAQGLTRNRGS